MSLERKDVRAKFDADTHAALVAICEADDMEIGAWVEREITRAVKKRIHDAQLIASKVLRLGKSGNARE